MFCKSLAVAALVGNASAYSMDTVTVDLASTLECGPCILGGYNFCTAKATMSYYSKLAAAYPRNDNTAMCCAYSGFGDACNNAAGVNVSNSPDWSCYNNPYAPTASNIY